MNEAMRVDGWAHMTIPSLRQVLLLRSTAGRGEMFARQPDGTWPEEAVPLGAEDTVEVPGLGFACPLPEFHARTALAVP